MPSSNSNDAVYYAELVHKLVPILRSHERAVAWMYLDFPEGHLTIGIGHLMIHSAEFTSESILRSAVEKVFGYGFKSRDTYASEIGLTSTSYSAVQPGPRLGLDTSNIGSFLIANRDIARIDDIARPGGWGLGVESFNSDLWVPTVEGLMLDAKAMNQVKGRNHTADYYKSYNRYELTDEAIDALVFDDIVDRALGPAKTIWPAFDSFPQAAQLALLDIAFQGVPVKRSSSMPHDKSHEEAAKTFAAGTGPAKAAFSAALAKAPPDFKAAAKQVPNLSTTWYANSSSTNTSERTRWRISQFLEADKLWNVGTFLGQYVKGGVFKSNLDIPTP